MNANDKELECRPIASAGRSPDDHHNGNHDVHKYDDEEEEVMILMVMLVFSEGEMVIYYDHDAWH